MVDARGSEPVVLREGSITREDLEVAPCGLAPPAPEGVVGVVRFRDVSELAQQLCTALCDAELADIEVLVVGSVPEAGVGSR